jgi:integrase
VLVKTGYLSRGGLLKLLAEVVEDKAGIGLRASESVQLRVEDISLAERVVTIRRGKGAERREVPIRR